MRKSENEDAHGLPEDSIYSVHSNITQSGGKMSKLQISYSSQTCAWCAGVGTQAVSAGYVVSCLVCGGKGHVSIGQPSAECRQCGGSGRRNADRPCLSCAGTGWGRVFGQV